MHKEFQKRGRKQRHRGFTLVELLIALSIMAVIATYSIPKIIAGQQSSKKNALAKEVAASTSAALISLRNSGQLTTSSTSSSLTPYLNYVSQDTSGAIDGSVGQTTFSCATYVCLRLHSGAKVLLSPACPYTVLDGTHAVGILVDPDGNASSLTSGDDKGVWFFLYADGRLTDVENLIPNTVYCGSPYSAVPNTNPPWFKW